MASRITTNRKPDSLKKLNLIDLKEVLNREEALLKNRSLMVKLHDKGDSIKKFYELVKNELKYREELAALESSVAALEISETEKHVQKICELEKSPGKERYKPFSTLNKTQEVYTNRKVFKTMEDWSNCNKPTKLIPLAESMKILKQQDEKLKEEHVKIKHRLLVRQLENEDSEESDNSNSNSEVESESEGEPS